MDANFCRWQAAGDKVSPGSTESPISRKGDFLLRPRVVGTFPDGNSALMLVCARLRYVASKAWGSKRYMSMKHLEEMQKEAANQVAG